ncbi:MAG: Arsenite methyltransferase [Planctomycetes bacterium]|nr:Arsenite methyltransferase [Planctomycetota bacterium]
MKDHAHDHDSDTIRSEVRSRYGAFAKAAAAGADSGCCGSGPSCGPGFGADPITRDLYGAGEAGAVPPDALAASLGCGNPTALAELRAGETVLDLGSGGGIDVLLSAKRVGPAGFAYGLDMTDEMLALAERNRAAAGAANVKFLKGHIEQIPLPDGSVDVIVSNCVINLSPDKARVLREAFRVLRPGGRLAVSDVVVQGEFPANLRKDAESWAGCVAGALEEGEYRRLLAEAGFVDVDVEVTRVHDTAELAAANGGASCCGGPAPSPGASACVPGAIPPAAGGGRLVSAFVRARKTAPDA